MNKNVIGASGRLIGTRTITIGDTTIVEYDMPKTPRRHRTRDITKFGSDSPSYTIKHKEDTNYKTITSQLETPNLRSFPKIRRSTISNTGHGLFYYPVEGPDVMYDVKTTTLDRGCTIGKRYYPRPPQTPGPGQYETRTKVTPKFATLPKQSKQDLWSVSDSPGPGQYNVTPPIKRAPRWFSRRRITAPPVDNTIY